LPDAVSLENRIPRNHRQIFFERLRNQKPVERIAMAPWQVGAPKSGEIQMPLIEP
jgi:hypothetical protein